MVFEGRSLSEKFMKIILFIRILRVAITFNHHYKKNLNKTLGTFLTLISSNIIIIPTKNILADKEIITLFSHFN